MGPSGTDPDVYSLGIIFYVLLTGRTPFTDRNPLAVMRMHEINPVPPLPATVPPDIAGIVYRLLSKDISARYESSRELIAALDRLVLHV